MENESMPNSDQIPDCPGPDGPRPSPPHGNTSWTAEESRPQEGEFQLTRTENQIQSTQFVRESDGWKVVL